jgi:transcriptional regulator with XRE-family HTH domain
MSSLANLFVKNARSRMAELKINQAELGRRLGVSSATVSTIFSLKNTPTLDTVERWADAMQTTASELLLDRLGEEREESPSDQKLRLITAILGADRDILEACLHVIDAPTETENPSRSPAK